MILVRFGGVLQVTIKVWQKFREILWTIPSCGKILQESSMHDPWVFYVFVKNFPASNIQKFHAQNYQFTIDLLEFLCLGAIFIFINDSLFE